MVAALNPSYVIAPSLEMFFIDKDTGLPLVNGTVYFYEDEARTVPKPVFEIVSAAPGGPYTYPQLPNPVVLSAVGTFQDGDGNNILPYYYPYDSNGNLELYYIEVYNSNGVLQFTREAWPNLPDEEINPGTNVINLIPNGQFLTHDNIPASSANDYTVGEISQLNTVIAPGGWEFQRQSNSPTDIVTFIMNPPGDNPTGNPPYSVSIQTTEAGSNSYKWLSITFPGVNTFASDTQTYNLFFQGWSATSSSIANCSVAIRKFFGTGGSPSATTYVQQGSAFTLAPGPNQQVFNYSMLFGSNVDETTGTNGDDYVQIIIALPPIGIQTAVFTNFALTIGPSTLAAYPSESPYQTIAFTLAGSTPTPDPNGFDAYLPIIYTPTGFNYDASTIGNIESSMENVSTAIYPTSNKLLCNGATYFTNDYSSLGIPYARLQSKLWNTSTLTPLFGTGPSYAIAYIDSGNTAYFVLAQNAQGSQTAPADGATATTFTFGATANVPTNTIGYEAYANSSAIVNAIASNSSAPLAGASAGTSGMSVASFNDPSLSVYYYQFTIVCVAASSLANPSGYGKYFTFSTNATSYYVWFKITNEMDPGSGGGATGTGIQVLLEANMAAVDVSNLVAAAISGFQVNNITVKGGASITAGSYFAFTTNAITYNVWYTVGGVGTAPSVSNLIPVSIASTATAAQVATATVTAINSYAYAVPNLQGVFLRGTDPNSIWDLNANDGNRWAYNSGLATTSIGSFERDIFLYHQHPGSYFNLPADQVGSPGANGTAYTGNPHANTPVTVAPQGGHETRPVNVFTNFWIRY